MGRHIKKWTTRHTKHILWTTRQKQWTTRHTINTDSEQLNTNVLIPKHNNGDE